MTAKSPSNNPLSLRRLATCAVLGATLVIACVTGAIRLVAASESPETASNAATSSQPQTPIAAGFIYPWYPSHWTERGVTPYTNYTPSLGWYSSLDEATIREQLRLAERSHLEAFLSSWWEPGETTDVGLQTILTVTEQAGSPMRSAIYYEREGYSDPTVQQIATDLGYLSSTSFQSPAYLWVNGKPVVFAYGAGTEGCSMIERWRWAEALAQVDAYVSLKVFPGYRDCPNQPDSWHQYSPSAVYDSQMPYSISVSPGFWKIGEQPLLARDMVYFETAVYWMAVQAPDWQLVTTWNEWSEGTAVEPAAEYGPAYLEILCTHLPGSGSCTNILTAATPTAPATNTATPTAAPSSAGSPPVGATASPTTGPSPTPTAGPVETAAATASGTPTLTPAATPITSPPAGPTQTQQASPTKSPRPPRKPISTATRTPAPTVSIGALGDLNCNRVIDEQDALGIIRLVASLTNEQPGDCIATTGLRSIADADCDGHVTTLDALFVLRISVGATVPHNECSASGS